MHGQSIVHLDLKPENIMCHTRTSHKVSVREWPKFNFDLVCNRHLLSADKNHRLWPGATYRI